MHKRNHQDACQCLANCLFDLLDIVFYVVMSVQVSYAAKPISKRKEGFTLVSGRDKLFGILCAIPALLLGLNVAQRRLICIYIAITLSD